MRRLAALFFVFLICSGARAASVWKVSDGTNIMYLGGTMHILSPSDYPLPEAYQAAYHAADTLVFETNIAALESPAFAQQSLALLTYGDGRALTDEISEDTFAALEKHLNERGVPVENFLNMRPAMVGIMLSMIEFQRMGLTSQGVDKFYYSKGAQDDKQLRWLETPEQQLAFIADMGKGDEDAYLRYSIDDVRELPALIPALREDWRSGDMEGLYTLAMEDFKREYPDVYSAILTDRNNKWLPQLTDMMVTPEKEFVLVGALHLPGEGGMLALLRRQGYTVEKLN